MRERRFISLFILASILSACNMPSSDPQYDFNQLSTFAAQTQTASGTQVEHATSQPSFGETPSPTTGGFNQTTVTAPAANTTQNATSCNNATFVGDVTVPDNTNFIVEKPFTKTWRLRNDGTCTWTSAYQLIFDSGERMSGPLTQQLTSGSVDPGQTIDVAVDLIAPALAGTYKSNWKIKDGSGNVFALASGPFFVQIVVKRGGVVVWHTYKQGDSAPEVTAIQYLLRQHGYSNLSVDGSFSDETRAKVKNFQNKNDIEEEDGAVGPKTWEVLVVTVSRGSSGDAVRAAQYLLQKKYGFTLEVDGAFGPITAQAVKDFQTKQGLTPDGVVGPLTWQKLIGK